MMQFHSNQSVGEIVTIMPKASDIFKKYKIDFCCGGHRPLSEAVKELNLDENEVLTRLEEAYDEMSKSVKSSDYLSMTSNELIDYIVNTHHVYVKRILPELSELTTAILRVHGKSHRNLFDVHKLFHNLKTELEQHLIKEEEILFPMIKEYEVNSTKENRNSMIEVMRETEAEHDAAGDILKELRRITEEYEVPIDACGTYFHTFELLQELESDLFQHIHLENNILFMRLGITV